MKLVFNKVVIAFVQDGAEGVKVNARLTLSLDEFLLMAGCVVAHLNFVLAMTLQSVLIRKMNQKRINNLTDLATKLEPYRIFPGQVKSILNASKLEIEKPNAAPNPQ